MLFVISRNLRQPLKVMHSATLRGFAPAAQLGVDSKNELWLSLAVDFPSEFPGNFS